MQGLPQIVARGSQDAGARLRRLFRGSHGGAHFDVSLLQVADQAIALVADHDGAEQQAVAVRRRQNDHYTVQNHQPTQGNSLARMQNHPRAHAGMSIDSA